MKRAEVKAHRRKGKLVKAHHKWMQGAVTHPGALRSEAKRLHVLKGNGKLTSRDLAELKARGERTGDSTLVKRATLAETFAKARKA